MNELQMSSRFEGNERIISYLAVIQDSSEPESLHVSLVYFRVVIF